ncbi:hypothetical protein, partial [Vibrio parahaemolyticus]|uniref:hypothetical protein n=1 Tax=Vibrio parahaemolyticus TaxID=670 RepID=UPI0038925F2D
MKVRDYYVGAVYKLERQLRLNRRIAEVCTEEFALQALESLNLYDVGVGYSNDNVVSEAMLNFNHDGEIRHASIQLCNSTIRHNCYISAIHEIAHVVHAVMM